MCCAVMKHILVLWEGEEKWDVYPITSISDTSIGLELMRDPTSTLKRLQGDFVHVKWDPTKPAAPAKILAVGSLASMEKKRNNRAAAHGSASTQDSESEDRDDQAKVILELQATVERLESELRQTKAQLQQARDCLDSSRMVRRLKHILDQTIGASGAIGGGSVEPGTVVSAPKVDLGEGILLDESTLTRLRRDAKNSGSRFARGLLKVLFSSEELENKSLFGRRSNAHKGAAQKEALDPRRVNAILSYTARHFDATTGEIKNTLSSMLARGY
ncbi:uncharacterized protein LOC142590457 isoform X7 [Dermacentor variabilis]|uniref:uncharacterized protein LOC142590457 isoform X7 n=1 Tax=Dermacentor variabilis TaxID=34621 RepID=UPI003F5AEFD2